MEGRNEDKVIKKLFEADKNYRDDLDYDLFSMGEEITSDWRRGSFDGYISNSYTRGLGEAVGLDMPSPDSIVPGYNKPVPKEEFQKDNKCES